MAIGTEYRPLLQGFQAADFTIDCNLGGQPILHGQNQGSHFAQVVCAAVCVVGRDTSIKRIRAIGFGTLAPGKECSVISVAGAHPEHKSSGQPADCVVDECIIEQPALNSLYVSTYLLLASGEGPNHGPTRGVMAWHRGCVVRNCFINGEFVDNPVAIESITPAGATATVVTRPPHGRAAGQWVIIAGAQVNGSLQNNFNGSYQISAVVSETEFQYTMQEWATPAMPSSPPTGDKWLGRWPSNRVGVGGTAQDPSIKPVGNQPGNRTYRIKSVTPHFRRPDSNVLVSGVARLGVVPPTANAFNGSFKIDSIDSPTELTYTLLRDPEGTGFDWPKSYIFIGAGGHQAITADGGTGTVVEANRVNNVGTGVYHDSFGTKDLIVRNNHFYRVNTGIQQELAKFSPDCEGKASIPQERNPTRGGSDNKTATFRTQHPHGFVTGQGVHITGVRVGGSASNPFNGYFAIASVAASEFTYVMASDPGADADAGITPMFAAKWQVRRLVIENNLIELGVHIHPRGYGPPTGIRLAGATFAQVYTFLQTLIRRNLIRHADSAVDLPDWTRGLTLSACENVLITGNVIDLDTVHRILFDDNSKLVNCFQNTTPSGSLIPGWNETSRRQTEEVSTRIEDALVLAI